MAVNVVTNEIIEFSLRLATFFSREFVGIDFFVLLMQQIFLKLQVLNNFF